MSNVILDITMSLDGFIAGPKITSDHPMGEGGEILHEWLFASKTDADSAVITESVATSGAGITGWGTYRTAIDRAWNGSCPFDAPVFVLSRQVPEKVVNGFTFVTSGIEIALKQARAATGTKNVWVMGGANVIQQFLRVKLFDELHLHVAPTLLGTGTRLFESAGHRIELEKTRAIDTPAATHYKFRPVIKKHYKQMKNSGNEPFVIEHVYKAPLAKVWKAITNKDDMKHWYFDLPEFKAEVGFEFQFKGGKDENNPYLHLCKVTEVVPGKKITYSWTYDGYEGISFVTFELFPDGNKTKLILTHAALETFPASQPDFAKKNFAESWTQIIGTSLKEFVEKS